MVSVTSSVSGAFAIPADMADGAAAFMFYRSAAFGAGAALMAGCFDTGVITGRKHM